MTRPRKHPEPRGEAPAPDARQEQERAVEGGAAVRARRFRWLLLWAFVLPLAGSWASEPGLPAPPVRPRIDPDYADLVIPPNIAPLNFRILESRGPGRVRLRGAAGDVIEVESRDQRVQFPQRRWRALLEANRGQAVQAELYRREPGGGWRLHHTFTNWVAREEIDGWLVYRLLRPLYTQYVDVSIHQRDLSSFEERVVLHNRSFDGGCVNCHSFWDHQPDTMALHLRTRSNGMPMLLAGPEGLARVEKTAGYLSWHPSGRWLAFSLNKLSMLFHTTGESRDVYDAHSDLGLYDVEANVVTQPPPLAQPGQMETWPAWSADGRSLYFCSAPKQPAERFREIRYDLHRVAFDPATGACGEVELMVNARALGRSVAQPRPSPDGRFLVFCLFDYGHFPIYQPGSDLQVMDLRAGGNDFRPLEINSPRADTWHCWSANSRWLVFSSKRRDGLFARPHFTYVDPTGRFHKPFVLPQEDPGFYDAFLKTYNVPELVRGPVPWSEADLAGAIHRPARVLRPRTSEADAADVREAIPPEGYARPGASRVPE